MPTDKTKENEAIAAAWDDAEKILRAATDAARHVLRAATLESADIEQGLAGIFSDISDDGPSK